LKPLYLLSIAAVEAVSKWRFEPAMKDGQPVSMWLEAEVNFNLNQEPQTGQAITRDGRTEYQGQEFKMRLGSDAQRRAEEEAQQRNNLELARAAKISMDQAPNRPSKSEKFWSAASWANVGKSQAISLKKHASFITSSSSVETSQVRLRRTSWSMPSMALWFGLKKKNASERIPKSSALNRS
jgi:hypothetical protein